jgi:glycosyl transferase, family 25
VKKIIEYFDRTYVINLSDRVDRRRQVAREFSRVGITIPNAKVLFYRATRPTEKGAFVSRGERGCFTSHKQILELACRDKLRNVLICEDDVCFRNVGSVFEGELLEQISSEENWDIIQFGYDLPPEKNLTGPLLRWQIFGRGTHFFAVNGPFIETMLQFMNGCELRSPGHPDGGPMSADGAYNHVRRVLPNIRLLLCVPNLAHQRCSRTDIASTPFFDKIAWLDPVLRAMREAKQQIRVFQDGAKLRRQLNRRPTPASKNTAI